MANKEATLLLKIKTAGEEALGKLKANFDVLKQAALLAFAAIAGAVVKSIADYREQEEATNALSRAMINQGIYTKALKDEYLQQASALQALTQYGDEQIIAAQAVLQGYLGQTKVSQELTQATLDLAAAKKMDLASAAELVGKTIGTDTNALARNGIEVNANASKQEKLAQVIGAVNAKYEGQAAAAAGGLGALKQLQNVVSDIFEVIGERLAPVIILFAEKLKALGTDTSVVTPLVNAFVGSLEILAKAGTIVAGIFEVVGKIIGIAFAGYLQAASEVLDGNFRKALETSGRMTEAWGEAVTSTYTNTTTRLEEIDAAFLAGKQENLDKEAQMEAESAKKRSEARQRAADQENTKKLEKMIEQQELEMELLAANEEQREMAMLDHQIRQQEALAANATDHHTKMAAMNEIYRLNEEKKELIAAETRKKNQASTFATIATMQNSNNKTLASIGKAAAITEIAIATPVAISKALAAFPPPFNFAAAGLVGAAMAAQAAQIAGVPLAEGGIVLPRNGGTQAIIGEAGQAEAVIPLDRMGEFGMGGGGNTVIINSYGGMLGNESEARQFAKAVDEQLLRLRQNNESVAFDSGVV